MKITGITIAVPKYGQTLTNGCAVLTPSSISLDKISYKVDVYFNAAAFAAKNTPMLTERFTVYLHEDTDITTTLNLLDLSSEDIETGLYADLHLRAGYSTGTVGA